MRFMVLLLLCGTAHADVMDRAQGGAWLHYELSEVHNVEDGSPSDLVLAGARLHGFVGEGATVMYAVGLDLAAGSTLGRAGLAYDVALFPVGVGVRFGRTSIATLATGVGAMGAVGSLDDAVTLPVELNIEAMSKHRVLARIRTAWVAGAAGRHDGARDVPFADELDATLGLRLGHHYEQHGYPCGNGYFFGIAFRELAGTRYLGAVIGYSIDLATARRSKTKQ